MSQRIRGQRIALHMGASESRYTCCKASSLNDAHTCLQRARYTQFAAMDKYATACMHLFLRTPLPLFLQHSSYFLNTSTTTSSSAIHASAWVHGASLNYHWVGVGGFASGGQIPPPPNLPCYLRLARYIWALLYMPGPFHRRRSA